MPEVVGGIPSHETDQDVRLAMPDAEAIEHGRIRREVIGVQIGQGIERVVSLFVAADVACLALFGVDMRQMRPRQPCL